MILVIDNYDSFTYNLVQYIGELGYEVVVKRNDEITCEEANALNPEKIVISPGPCTPLEAGISVEIINELEPSSRGIYGGAIGHISWDGDIDTAIAIRTAVIKNNKIHVGAGAGVVADSIPENEWNECLQKAHVFLDAIEMIK